MNKSREKVDLSLVQKLYGAHHKITKVTVRQLFYESQPGNDYTGPEGWTLPHTPLSLEEAADTIATQYNLLVEFDGGGSLCPDFLRSEVIKPRFDRDKPRTYLAGRLRLIFFEDIDTPVLVEYRAGKGEVYTGTYTCVSCEQEVDGYRLSDKQILWLEEFESEIDDWMEKVRSRQENQIRD